MDEENGLYRLICHSEGVKQPKNLNKLKKPEYLAQVFFIMF